MLNRNFVIQVLEFLRSRDVDEEVHVLDAFAREKVSLIKMLIFLCTLFTHFDCFPLWGGLGILSI